MQSVSGVKNMKMVARSICKACFSEKHKFTNVIEFKDALLLEKERFVRGLAGHVLAFSLGRQLSPVDQIALDEIVEKIRC